MTFVAAQEPDEGEVACDLVQRIAAGDPAAEAQLVARYSRGLLYLLQRLGASPELAEDLHQETFRIVLERIRRSGLAQPAALVGFLRGMARNLVLAEHKKRVRRRTEGLDPLDLAAAEDPAPSQLQAVLWDEQAAQVRRLIAELATDRDRQVLLRFYVGEEDKARICADLQLDSLAFNRVLFRARQRLKQLMEHGRKGA